MHKTSGTKEHKQYKDPNPPYSLVDMHTKPYFDFHIQSFPRISNFPTNKLHCAGHSAVLIPITYTKITFLRFHYVYPNY